MIHIDMFSRSPLFGKQNSCVELGFGTNFSICRVLETLHIALTWQVLYVTTVTDPGVPLMSNSGIWPLAVVVPTTALVGFIVQVRSGIVALLRPSSASSIQSSDSSRYSVDCRHNPLRLCDCCGGSLHPATTTYKLCREI